MKNLLLIIFCLVVITGCGNKQTVDVKSTKVDNGLMEAEQPDKLLKASDVSINDDIFLFAYSNEVVPEYSTFDNSKPLTITSESDLELKLFTSSEDVRFIDFTEPSSIIELKANQPYTVENIQTYNQIWSETDANIVISVM